MNEFIVLLLSIAFIFGLVLGWYSGNKDLTKETRFYSSYKVEEGKTNLILPSVFLTVTETYTDTMGNLKRKESRYKVGHREYLSLSLEDIQTEGGRVDITGLASYTEASGATTVIISEPYEIDDRYGNPHLQYKD